MVIDSEDTTVRQFYGRRCRPREPLPAAAPSIDTVESAAQKFVDTLRRRRYRRPSVLMEWLKKFDDDTFAHCVRVSELAVSIGELLNFDRAVLRRMERAALIHDAGKLCVPIHVLNKPDRLSDVEWEIMRAHSIAGESICYAATEDRELSVLVRQHHERLDGGGYPDALSDIAISPAVRVLQIADIFDALTTARAYKPAFSHVQALEIIDEEVACGWRDAEVVDALCRVVN